jgi:hypothetical protein
MRLFPGAANFRNEGNGDAKQSQFDRKRGLTQKSGDVEE